MKIGIDIDDTITCMSEIYYSQMQKWYLENEDGNVNNSFFQSKDIYNCLEDFSSFWDKFVEYKIFNVNIRDGAREVIDKLISEGHEIYIITARSNRDSENYIERSKNWLDKNDIHYKEAHFNSKGKRQKMIDLGIDVMIDDSKDVMDNAIDSGVKGIIMNTFFNTDYNKCNRAYTWYDVYYYINEYQKELEQKA